MYRTTLLCALCLQLLLSSAVAQDTGEYPAVASVATYRPVTADSVCGANGSEQYCQFTTDAAASLLPNCIEATCNNTCPFSSSSPSPFRLAEVGAPGAGVTPSPGREGNGSTALRFENSFVDIAAELVPALTELGFSFAAWINREEGTNRGTLISKSTSDPDAIERNYAISVDENSLTFDYLPDTLDTSSLPEGSQRYRTVLVEGLSLPASVWHHVAVTVYAEDAAIYVNGTVEGVAALEGRMVDTNRDVLLGQSSEGVGSYSGLMEEMYLYTQALTEREVMELVDGSFPFVHLSTGCRCPPSHPVIDIDSEARCIQHTGASLVSRGTMERVNPLAHPPGFINDFGTGADNGWISAPGDRQANVTITLTNSLYELIFINFRFGSPRFKAAVLETSRNGGVTFEPIQYFADDCMTYFSLPDNGPITEADSVNCITTQSFQIPTFGVDIRVRPLDQQIRPFDLNTSPELRNFILSSHLRLRLVDLFTESTSTQHQYYNILEVTVAARCACNGHSDHCGNSIDSVCECAHNTAGDTCDRCLPLYNEKPWQYGETNNAYPCKMCDCNGHADSCHYNASVDPFPNSYDQGGGGVCDNCQSNTAGQHCETCALTFYRPSGVSSTDSTPCVPCGCDLRGVTDNGDCVKSEGIPGQVVGQCQCKTNVIGLQCDTCQDGFFALSVTNPQGCSPCNCNTDGTVNAGVTCNAITGQCQCKENVMGLKCDQCVNGTTSLTSINELGCSPCACDPDGSLSSNCDAVSGACDCRPGVGGLLCDECLDGYFGFSETGCEPCTCNASGVDSNVCNKTTGECPCLANVEGQNCDLCASGYYNLTAGCVECGCDSRGTVGGDETCHSVTGQCQCKDNVEGRTCNACVSGFTNLNASDVFGCTECNCSDFGTNRTGSICDPVTSQCHCLPSATGIRCDGCVDGFYSTAMGCVECGCDPDGSSSDVCDEESGRCPCNNGVGGRQCDACLNGFFQFPSCTSCGCNSAGTVGGSECDVDTGECNCKTFVTGDFCSVCQPGYQMLDASNPFGCSAAPDEQGPPTATPLSSTIIRLTWLPPEAPNGVILGYQVYRNGFNVANTTDTSYNDTDLTPNTLYTYFIVSFNIIGSTSSAEVSARTLEGIPTGVSPPVYPVVNSTAVEVSWSEPDVSHGTIIHYRLILVEAGAQITEEEVFRGLAFSYVVTNLQPFTVYSFVVEACTSGGCGPSDPSQVQTAEAPPTFQPAPTVATLSATSLSVQWIAPDQPNGVIVRYNVFQREAPFEGGGVEVAMVNSSVFSVEVGGLLPFTAYQFSVESHTQTGGTRSQWSEGMTAQSAPSDVPPPSITALSPTSLQVSWTEPDTPNGVITQYIVYSISDGSSTFLTNSSSTGAHVVSGLQPFTEYSFLVEACTIAGCTESAVGSGFTEESVPSGQSDPTLSNVTASSVSLQWAGPAQPNGIITNYLVHRRTPSLLPSPAIHDVGVSFTGNSFVTFTPARPSRFDNELSLRFRTLDCCGLLFYSINTAETDMLAVELRNGVPWFIFDAGTGPGAIRPDGDPQVNDGSWHTLRVTQEGSNSTITVDGVHSGSGVSLGTATVVGYVMHYVGGIPSDSPRQTTNGHLNPSATLVGRNFAGCLFDVTFNDVSFDFSSSDAMGVGSLVQGCPVEITPTAQFLGGGYLALEEDTISGNSFNASFRFRTTHADGLLFFMHASDDTVFGIELRDSDLHLVLSGVTDVTTTTGQQLCDGEWHSVYIEQEGNQLWYAVNEVSDVLTLPNSTIFSSRLFFGGVPGDSATFQLAQDAGLDVYTPFSGCVRMPNPLLHVAEQPVMGTIVASELVNFDGCGDAPGSSCVSPWTDISTGMSTSTTDLGLTPFTAYLYRVEARNSVGSAYSSWEATNTLQSAPTGVGSVTLSSSTSSSLTLTWDRPTAPNGLVIQYTIIATPPSPAQEVTMSVDITEPEQTLEITLEGLLPFTTYSTTLSASTAAGTGSGAAVSLTTMESAPIGVQPAYVTTLGSRSLVLSWNPPTQPNGIITEYNLFVDDELRFSGPETIATVDNLLPSTLYTFHVQACTSAGCANSSETGNTTLPDRPAGLSPPSVIALTPTSLEITWEEPTQPNGEILQYELQQLSGENLSDVTTLTTGLEFSYQLTGLTPNTLYSFRVLATNAGGTTISDIAQNRTLEDAPDGLTAPVLTVLNATAIRVSWVEPAQPNGVITEYILFRDGTEVFSGLELSFVDGGLEPFTSYSYAIQACTSGNCSTSTHSSARTEEATPEGVAPPIITATTATSFTVTISAVTQPNGIVQYVLRVTGEFASSPEGAEETTVVFNDTEPGVVDVSDLLPFSDYQVDLTVSNGAGSQSSPTVTAMTEPAAPEGLAPPTLSLVDATTLRVSWSAPDRPNDDTVNYLLTISNDRDAPIVSDQGLNTSATIAGLQPFTAYTVQVLAYNSIGNISSLANITTGETAPTGFDQVVVQQLAARFILLSWDSPARPNGILTNYTILQGAEAVATVSPSSEMYNVTSLRPFTSYQFSVVACTAAGCVQSPQVQTMTLEDVPEGVQAPSVGPSGIGVQLLVSWASPDQPNGVILLYYIDRALAGSGDFVRLGSQTDTQFRFFADVTALPFTEYDYRIVVVNSAGSAAGPATTIRSPEAAPGEVQTPTLSVLSSSAIEVSFQPPLSPNGIITSYTLTRYTSTSSPVTIPLNTSSLPFTNGSYVYEDTPLAPFTNHTYTLTVCTSAGCTTSSGVWSVTDEATPTGLDAPTTNTINHTSILVSWNGPTEPNGVVLGYDILQRSLGFEVPPNITALPNCCQEYLLGNGTDDLSDGCSLVEQTDPDTMNYTVTELQAFSNYQYCIIVTNGADSTFSSTSPVTQTSAAPMPLTGPQLTASTVNSTAISLSWSSLNVSQLLGPLEGYTLYGREAGEAGPGEVLFSGGERQFTAGGLVASTEYVFVVSVSNGRGSTFGNEASATTEEGIPANLSAPQVQALSATVISITWTEPNEPNGIIISYTIFINSVDYYNQTVPGTLLVEGLSPFTLYTVRVEACTQFGCTRSPQVEVMTLESAPVGLASPTVNIIGPTSAEISWTAPSQANGVITNYQLFQTEGTQQPFLVFEGLSFRYSALDLRPFTTYGFEIYAINGAGNVSSGVTMATTEEAPPTSIDPPTVTVISSTEIQLQWEEPEELNGILLGYQLYRNGSLLQNNTFATTYTDLNLDPFTRYSYVIEVCTNGGCTSSAPVSNMTLEALPEGVPDLTILDLQARSLVLSWQEPDKPNGIITEYILYQLYQNGSTAILFQGLAFSFPLTGLTPHTTYSFFVETCNSVGCTQSSTATVSTLQAPPEGVRAPTLRDLTSTSAHIEWTAPTSPNGIITNYTLRRAEDGSESIVVFQGLAFSFDDTSLLANTLYAYTVEATNAGGSTESAPSYIQTVPDLADGIAPPEVEVQGPTSIRVTWTAPEFPNGEISLYILYLDGEAVFSGLGFEYSRTDLSPFTEYMFYYEVVNQAGPAGSTEVTARTDPALPEGLLPPTLTVLGATAIQVTWQPPSAPNGEVTQYRVRRRLFENPPTEFLQYFSEDTSVLSFINSGLEPFTRYEYRLEVFNQAGSSLSEFSDATTDEDIPQGVPAPTVENVFARNVTASWSPPMQPNGIITGYRLEYRLLLDPATNLPGETVIAAETAADVTTATATGLLPVTTYEFRVAAINSADEGFGDWEVVTTAEDVPEGLTPIVVETRTEASLTLTWGIPANPNGVIRDYIVLLDGDVVYRDAPTTYIVTRLQPFTSYSLQLAACTSAGCTYGDIQFATTAEAAPAGQAAPTVVILGPRSVEISWTPPSSENGIIILYEVLRQEGSLPASVVFTTDNVATRMYLDGSVLPATSYRYAIAANNSAGRVESEFNTITTPEAAPEGVGAPRVRVTSSRSIEVSWDTPAQPNGFITEYRVFRDGGGLMNQSVYTGQNRQFTDENLTPFTVYSYTLQACTGGGCGLSSSISNTTFEDSPEGFDFVQALPLSESSITAQWAEPSSPNGVILRYMISVAVTGGQDAITIVTTDLSVTATNLEPFTNYTVTVDACNSIGCATGSSTVVTLESIPQFIAPPTLEPLDPTSISARWEPPARPNGVIVNYILRRDGVTIFEGNALEFNDTNLLPNQVYSYTVQAFTTVGGGEESSARSVQTPPDTPEDISPPVLTVLGAESIRAEWMVPGQPNGAIQQYILSVNGTVVFTGLSPLQFTVDGLTPFTVYEFRLDVCTTTCGNSSSVTVRTGEAPPTGQAPPMLNTPFQNTTVQVTWQPPAVPNGIITEYRLERRLSTETDFILIYSGPDLEFHDSGMELRPATAYEYRVTSLNSAGSNTSGSSSITLPEAAPENIPQPQFTAITSSSLVVIASPPDTPNGQLTQYILYQNDSRVNELAPANQGSTVEFMVTGLQPYTIYAYRVEVCTSGGCGTSEVAHVTTAEDTPGPYGSTPMGVALSARSILVSWSPPSQPNGVIQSYSLLFRLSCPQPDQPQLSPQPDCSEGTLTRITTTTSLQYTFTGSTTTDPFPYSRYQFLVEAQNSVGAVNSSLSDPVETQSSAPEVKGDLQFETDQANGIITLDWSSTFRPNGPVQRYTLTRNGIPLSSRPATTATLPNEPMGIELSYVVTLQTGTDLAAIGEVATEPIVLQLDDLTTAQPPTNATTEPSSEDTPFHQEAAFIIGMVILGISLLFIFGAVFLCFVRPRGDPGYPTSPHPVHLDHTPTKQSYEMKQKSPPPFAGSWSPGQPIWEDLPDLGEQEGPLVTPRKKKSYSPRREEKAVLLEEEEEEEEILPDTHITGYANGSIPRRSPYGPQRTGTEQPNQHTVGYTNSYVSRQGPYHTSSAEDDFGTFRASQTTFADTKV